MTEQDELKDIQVVIFRLGEEEYCVEVASVKEIIRMVDITCIPGSPGFIEGIINLRGQICTVIDLRKRFGIEPKSDVSTRIIISDLKSDPVGFVVDSVSEVKVITKEHIEMVPSTKYSITQEYLKNICNIDGDIYILLDIEKILGELEQKEELEMQNAV